MFLKGHGARCPARVGVMLSRSPRRLCPLPSLLVLAIPPAQLSDGPTSPEFPILLPPRPWTPRKLHLVIVPCLAGISACSSLILPASLLMSFLKQDVHTHASLWLLECMAFLIGSLCCMCREQEPSRGCVDSLWPCVVTSGGGLSAVQSAANLEVSFPHSGFVGTAASRGSVTFLNEFREDSRLCHQ